MNNQFEENDPYDENQTPQNMNYTDVTEKEKIDLENACPPTNSTDYNKSTENQDQSPPQESDYTDSYNKKNTKNTRSKRDSENLDASQNDDEHENQETRDSLKTGKISPKQEKFVDDDLQENKSKPRKLSHENRNKRNSATEYSLDQNNISLVQSEILPKKESNNQRLSASILNSQKENDQIKESQNEKIGVVEKEVSGSKTWNSDSQKGTEPFIESKKLENIQPEEPQKLQKISRNSSIEDPNKSSSKNYLQGGNHRCLPVINQIKFFSGEGTVSQVSKKEMRISKTIETQTNDIEFPSSYVTGLQSERVDITIPETKVIKDG